jgi:hypothetical protein
MRPKLAQRLQQRLEMQTSQSTDKELQKFCGENFPLIKVCGGGVLCRQQKVNDLRAAFE